MLSHAQNVLRVEKPVQISKMCLKGVVAVPCTTRVDRSSSFYEYVMGNIPTRPDNLNHSYLLTRRVDAMYNKPRLLFVHSFGWVCNKLALSSFNPFRIELSGPWRTSKFGWRKRMIHLAYHPWYPNKIFNSFEILTHHSTVWPFRNQAIRSSQSLNLRSSAPCQIRVPPAIWTERWRRYSHIVKYATFDLRRLVKPRKGGGSRYVMKYLLDAWE
jgi:hypothetical protein